jgi:hypothetical protein
MARTHRKYSAKKYNTSKEEKLNYAMNTDYEYDELASGYKISGKKRWNRKSDPDFDTKDDWG